MGCYFSELFLTEETDLLVKTTRLFSHILLVVYTMTSPALSVSVIVYTTAELK